MVGLWGANTSYGGPVGGKHIIGFQKERVPEGTGSSIWSALGL